MQNAERMSPQELKAFLGLIVATASFAKLPVPSFARVTARDRFLDICYNIHLSDNSKMPDRNWPGYGEVYKITPFIEDLNTNFGLRYSPHRKQSIDEVMIKYKGRTNLKQYMPLKPIEE